MLTVKHIEEKNGITIHESVVLAVSISYFPEGEDVGQPAPTPPFVRAFGVVGGGVNGDGENSYANGRIYVMNDNGKTIANYDLDYRKRSVERAAA